MESIIQKGFLEKFVIMYFDEMYALGHTYISAIYFFNQKYKENQINNLFDFIEIAKKESK